MSAAARAEKLQIDAGASSILTMKTTVSEITSNVTIPLPGYAVMNVLHAGSGPEAAVADCVGDLYAAASGERNWETALGRLGRMLGSTSGILFIDDPAHADVDLLALPGWSAAAVALYATRYRSLDPYAAFARRNPAAACLLGHEMVDPDQLRNSEIWVDFGSRHLPAFHFIGVIAPLERGRGGRLAWHRPQDAPAFGEGERELMHRLLPHLQRTLQLRDRLQPTGLALRARAFDQVALPLLVLGPTGAVLAINPAGERACRSGAIRLDRSGLHAADGADDRRLQRVIHDAASGGAGGGLLLRSHGGHHVCAVLVCRMPDTRMFAGIPTVATGRAGACVLVTIRILAPRRPADPGRLCDLFGLSAVEAQVACAIAAGASVAAVAGSRRTSPLTVRAQIRAILLKTGSENLRDLVAIVSEIEASTADRGAS